MSNRFLAFLSSVSLAACASTAAAETGLPNVDYSATADENFARAEEAFADEDYLEATALYEHVKNHFPYSRRAADSELRLADTLFEQAKYSEAEDAYATFARLHPAHEQAHYASFRVGLCHYKDIPGDHFFMPPSYEKDQGDVRQAARSLAQFVAAWPASPHRREAEELIQDCKRRLAEHELYVASFYERREKMAAVALRLEKALADYPNSGKDDEALVRLAKAYQSLGEKEKARGALERLLRDFPASSKRVQAEDLLKAM